MSERGNSREGRPGGTRSDARDWLVASVQALIVFALAYAGFVVVPDALVTHLFEGLAPRTRDALVLLWVVVWFVAMSWLFVRIQMPMRRDRRAVRS
jgi:hypothetical protein